MANPKDCSFLPPHRILTFGGFVLFVLLCAAFSFCASVLSAEDYYLEPNTTVTLGEELRSASNNVYVRGGTLKVDGSPDLKPTFVYDQSSVLTVDINNASMLSTGDGHVTPMTQTLLSSDSRDIYLINSAGNAAYFQVGTNYEYGSSYGNMNYSNFTGAYVAKDGAEIRLLTGHNIDSKLRAESGGTIYSAGSRTCTNSVSFVNGTFKHAANGILTANGIDFTGDCTVQSTGASNQYHLLKNTRSGDNISITGSGTITFIGNGYIAFAIKSDNEKYLATEYTGDFIIGTSSTAGKLALEGDNVINANTTIKSINGTVDWAYKSQSFKALEYKSGTMDRMTGTLTISDKFLFDSSDNLTVPGVIAGSAKLTKEGSGTLTLSQVPQYTGSTTVETGTLELPGGSTLYNLSGGSESNPATLTVTGNLTLSNDDESTFIGSITAQKITVNTINDVALKLYTGANNKVTADSLTVSSGELDFKGYFEGNIEVFNGSVFSPGNSVGTATIKGDITFADATADSNGVALFEFGEYADGADVNHDLFVMESGGIFTADDGVILLDFANNDADSWATEGNEFQLVSGGGFDDNVNYNPWLGNMTDLFKLEGRSNDGLYLVGIKAAPEPGSGVPEPSTWALLALGVVVLFLRKRVRN